MVGGALLDRRLGDADRTGDSRPAAGGSRGPAARADLEPRGGPQSAGALVHHPGRCRPHGVGAGRGTRPDPAHEREDAGVTVRLIDATRRWFLGLLAAALLTLPAAAQPQPALPHSDLVIETAKGPQHFTVELASSDESRARGLMLRQRMAPDRSEERRVGKECVSTCRSQGSSYT